MRARPNLFRYATQRIGKFELNWKFVWKTILNAKDTNEKIRSNGLSLSQRVYRLWSRSLVSLNFPIFSHNNKRPDFTCETYGEFEIASHERQWKRGNCKKREKENQSWKTTMRKSMRRLFSLSPSLFLARLRFHSNPMFDTARIVLHTNAIKKRLKLNEVFLNIDCSLTGPTRSFSFFDSS